jgi:hypothetical protein
MALISVFAGIISFPSIGFPQSADGVKPKTQKQIEHDKIFDYDGDKDPRVPVHRLTDVKGDSILTVESDLEPHYTGTRRSIYAYLACRADAVVRGKVVAQTSVLTTNESFVFTDADLSVTTVFKDNSALHIAGGQTITVTRPGGTVIEDGRKLSVRVTSLRDFSVGGDYLLFLAFLPASQDYRAIGSGGRSYQIRGGLLQPMDLYPQSVEQGEDDAATALADLAFAVKRPCQ